MDYKKFLEAISKIESSGGKNFAHERLNKGIHQGHRAIGSYGLMPNTVDEMIASQKINLPIPRQQAIKRMNAAQKKAYLEQYPEAEYAIAEALAKKVGNQYGNDPNKMAYSWNQGHNLPPDDPRFESIENHDYINKFKKYYEPKSEAVRTLLELEDRRDQFNKRYPPKK